jgi:hypothetical protein
MVLVRPVIEKFAGVMFGSHAQAGAGAHGVFGHPVLGCGPGQVADLLRVASYR